MAEIECRVDFENYYKNKEFTDISSEQYRVYVFANEEKVKIDKPQWLNVSPSGGHRIIDASGFSHYIPCRWIHLYWLVYEDAFYFVR